MQFEVVSEEAKATASLNGKQPPCVVFIWFPLVCHIFTPFKRYSIPVLGAKVQRIISVIRTI